MAPSSKYPKFLYPGKVLFAIYRKMAETSEPPCAEFLELSGFFIAGGNSYGDSVE